MYACRNKNKHMLTKINKQQYRLIWQYRFEVTASVDMYARMLGSDIACPFRTDQHRVVIKIGIMTKPQGLSLGCRTSGCCTTRLGAGYPRLTCAHHNILMEASVIAVDKGEFFRFGNECCIRLVSTLFNFHTLTKPISWFKIIR